MKDSVESAPIIGLNLTEVAKICHATNRQYCQAIGDNTILVWDALDDAGRYSVIHAVKLLLFHFTQGSMAPPDVIHAHWVKIKRKQGWTYGPTLDSDAKQHPALVPYAQLPPWQQLKDTLIHAVVLALYSSGIPIEISEISAPEPQSRIIIPSC